MVKKWTMKILVSMVGVFTYAKVGYPYIVLALVLPLTAYLTGKSWLHMWVLLILGAVMVISEMLNYSIERLCNLVEKNYNKDVKVIKDICSGTVLVSAVVLGVAWVWVMFQ